MMLEEVAGEKSSRHFRSMLTILKHDSIVLVSPRGDSAATQGNES